jgi:hypothetical protein
MIHWTTIAPLGLSILHSALVHDETAITNAASIMTFAVLLELMSSSDLHGVSIALAAPTVVALATGVGFEFVHTLNFAAAQKQRDEDMAHWRTVQREALRQDAYNLLAARMGWQPDERLDAHM